MNPISLVYYSHNSNIQPTHISRGHIDYYDLTIVQKGVLYYVTENTTVTLNQGDLILFRPGDYRQRLDSTVSSSYVSFNFYTDLDLSNIPFTTENALTPELSLLLTACDNFYNKLSDYCFERIAYILGAILLYLRDSVGSSQSNSLAAEIKNYILNNYTNQITLQEISELFHFSASYCNNVFKKENQKPIVDFVIEERIRKAKDLLIHTTLTLPQIASKVGYEDYNYFSRIFKRHTQNTPMQYRKLYS